MLAGLKKQQQKTRCQMVILESHLTHSANTNTLSTNTSLRVKSTIDSLVGCSKCCDFASDFSVGFHQLFFKLAKERTSKFHICLWRSQLKLLSDGAD